jgi:hypothetical protein
MKTRFIYFGHLNHVRQCRRFFCFYRSVIVVEGSPVVFEVVFDPSFANVKESEQSTYIDFINPRDSPDVFKYLT